MHTVENAVIIPLFTLIIIALISVSGYMYDRVTMQYCSESHTGVVFCSM